MTVPTGNNISVKECNDVRLGNRNEKLWHLQITTMPVIVETPGVIKNGTDKYID